MAVLDISGASHGFDVNGLENLYEQIKTEVIKPARNQLETEKTTLKSTIDEIWQGESAKNFKKNLDDDIDAIKDALTDSEELFHSELAQIATQMNKADEQAVERH